MRTRDEYVATLKNRLDGWNKDMERWEGKARDAGAEARERYERELAVLNAQRELARYNLRLLEDASLSAWVELRKGADEAWERMREAAEVASGYFEKVPAKKLPVKKGPAKKASAPKKAARSRATRH